MWEILEGIIGKTESIIGSGLIILHYKENMIVFDKLSLVMLPDV